MTTLTMKEEKRLEIIQRVYRGELTVVEAVKFSFELTNPFAGPSIRLHTCALVRLDWALN